MILVIDNYDSFTYNLVHILEKFDQVKVFRNDKISIKDIKRLKPDNIVISPGPGRPEDAGISKNVINVFKDQISILGVCLGHQCIGEIFGGEIIKAEQVFHGKVSEIIKIDHSEKLFAKIKNRFLATRYHSLIISKDNFPEELEIIAETDNGEIMAVKHSLYKIYGLQFHPESILTEVGEKIIQNFLNIRSDNNV